MLPDGFASLFDGNQSAHGVDAGGCVRTPPDYAAHLRGEGAIGIYPMVPLLDSWRVKFGCVDLDIASPSHVSYDYATEDEAHRASLNLQKVLKHLGATSWIERTRSCGRHVWLFASMWVPASTMRHALQTACKVAGVSSREINPKQSKLGDGQLGNYVRLPYPSGLRPNSSKQTIIDNFGSMPPQQFVRDALAARTSLQTLEAIAAKWKAPERERVPYDGAMLMHSGMVAEILPLLNRAGHSVFENGPNDGDRSRGLSYLARQARNSGLTPSQALTLLKAAPWQKFRDRHDEEQRLREIVEWAWQ